MAQNHTADSLVLNRFHKDEGGSQLLSMHKIRAILTIFLHSTRWVARETTGSLTLSIYIHTLFTHCPYYSKEEKATSAVLIFHSHGPYPARSLSLLSIIQTYNQNTTLIWMSFSTHNPMTKLSFISRFHQTFEIIVVFNFCPFKLLIGK